MTNTTYRNAGSFKFLVKNSKDYFYDRIILEGSLYKNGRKQSLRSLIKDKNDFEKQYKTKIIIKYYRGNFRPILGN